MGDSRDRRRHEELGAFLRSRRARITPADVGLEVSPRRRTPGLRREEVASLTGISATWYTWLEQGRDVRPSKQVVECLARALRLSAAETEHLHVLARSEALDLPAKRSGPSGLVTLIETMEFPAYVRDRASYLLGWNKPAEELFGDFAVDVEGSPNLLAYLFLSPRARQVFADWSQVAAASLAQFRRYSASDDHDEIATLIADLRSRSRDFVEMWDRFVVQESYIGQRVLNHPILGPRRYNYATLASYHGGAPWMSLYTPVTAQTVDEPPAGDVSSPERAAHFYERMGRPHAQVIRSNRP